MFPIFLCVALWPCPAMDVDVTLKTNTFICVTVIWVFLINIKYKWGQSWAKLSPVWFMIFSPLQNLMMYENKCF